ncbi:autotransporter outer membrane beta-barrel domain-containing protein [Brucella intermedia]|uniref:autotransporter outer membrane beta-barrel domain-containing protein n=1 Tax=Brucella intermedia TaxID=94625 RepID=UPI00236151F3|nr:autotransporter outer membrane beta-barrel domain-containing protein [Brucella intermedia]
MAGMMNKISGGANAAYRLRALFKEGFLSEQPAPADRNLGPFAFWSDGFVNLVSAITASSIWTMRLSASGGIDYRFSERLVTDFGVGYGQNRTDIGDNATESRANAYRAAVYGSFKPFDNFFVDALTGGSIQHFGSTRFIKTDGSFTDGKRNCVQVFGSLMEAYEFRRKTWLVLPYGRLEMSCSSLDG